MDLTKFNLWMIENFEFDCFENDFFEKTLFSVANEFSNSTIDGVNFEQYFRDNLFQEFLLRYRSRLSMLIRQIPQPQSPLQLNVVGIDLNSYFDQKEYLQQKVARLNY